MKYFFYGYLPSADSKRAAVSFWQKNVHNTGQLLSGLILPSKVWSGKLTMLNMTPLARLGCKTLTQTKFIKLSAFGICLCVHLVLNKCFTGLSALCTLSVFSVPVQAVLLPLVLQGYCLVIALVLYKNYA